MSTPDPSTPAIQQPKKKRQRAPLRWRFAMIGVVVLAVICFFVYRMVSNVAKKTNPYEATASIPAPGDINKQATIPGGTSVSQVYTQQSQQQTQQQADTAIKNGDTYIPPVVGNVSQSTAITPPAPAPVQQQYTPPPAPAPQNYSGANQQDVQTAQQQLAALTKSWEPTSSPISGKVYSGAGQAPASAGVGVLNITAASGVSTAPAPSTKTAATSTSPSPVRPGQIYYAANDLTLNSDIGGPVVATILSGPLKNSKVTGKFDMKDDHLIVAFDSLTTPDGTTYRVQGVAVDPKMDQAAVVSDYDTHWLSRWGGLLTASLAEGFGEAAQASGQTSVTSTGPGGAVVATANNPYGLKTQAEIAGGKAGQAFSNIAQQNFTRPDTVWLYANQPIGILFLGSGG